MPCTIFFVFFFNDTATTEIYTLSLHDALPISVVLQQADRKPVVLQRAPLRFIKDPNPSFSGVAVDSERSEEHTSELQSQSNLVCRLLLEKKKNFYSQSLLPYTTQFTR